jgi:hypothetical protein
VSFASITFRIASQRVFVVVAVVISLSTRSMHGRDERRIQYFGWKAREEETTYKT